jgi:hypothetical protein
VQQHRVLVGLDAEPHREREADVGEGAEPGLHGLRVELDLQRLLLLGVLLVERRLVETGVLEGGQHRLGVRHLGRCQGPLGEAPELRCSVGVVAIGVREQALQHRVVWRQRRTAAETQLAGQRVGLGRRLAVAVAQQLDHLAGEAGDDVRFAGLERGEEAAAAASLEGLHSSARCNVAHSPYSCIACT